MSAMLKLCSWFRDIAPRALPNGDLLDFPRADLDAYWGEPTDWDWFCGLGKKPKSLAPIYFFRPREAT